MRHAKSFFSHYENLEFLGDAVHKFFVVKRLKEKLDRGEFKAEDFSNSTICTP